MTGTQFPLAVGIDVVSIGRFAAALNRTPALAGRLFASDELTTASGNPRRPASLAARFAAKEAVAKALDTPTGLDWHDCRVITGERGRPILEMRGTVAEAAAAQGISSWLLSLTHDAGIAAAMVLALGPARSATDDPQPMIGTR